MHRVRRGLGRKKLDVFLDSKINCRANCTMDDSCHGHHGHAIKPCSRPKYMPRSAGTGRAHVDQQTVVILSENWGVKNNPAPWCPTWRHSTHSTDRADNLPPSKVHPPSIARPGPTARRGPWAMTAGGSLWPSDPPEDHRRKVTSAKSPRQITAAKSRRPDHYGINTAARSKSALSAVPSS